MVVGLCDCIAVPTATTQALPIGGNNARVRFRMLPLQPPKQSGAKIKTDVGVVVDNLLLAAMGVNNDGRTVWPIAFRMDAFVPVMKGMRAGLGINYAGPRVFTWWLIKMAMNDESSHLELSTGFTRSTELKIVAVETWVSNID